MAEAVKAKETKESAKPKELLAPVPDAAEYSVSPELWQRLEAEIKIIVGRINRGDELTPNDVSNVRKLRKQVDDYITSFNKAMRNSQDKYKQMVNKILDDIDYGIIEEFILQKRKEQTATENERIAYKMGSLKNLSEGLINQTKKLKDIPMAQELLPAFTARFPKIQSGAKNNDITNWAPYYSILSQTVDIIDAFFCDPKYEEAELLPLQSGTIRELLAYAKDGNKVHLENVKIRFTEDQNLIRIEKLKRSLTSKTDGIEHIRRLLDDLNEANEAVKQIRTEQTWAEISLIVSLVNNK